MATVTIPFDVNESKESGFYVSGTSGSGKTQLTKHLVNSLLGANCAVLVFDTSQAWNNNSPIANVVTLKTPLGQTIDYPLTDTVFDISRLKIGERGLFVNAICRAVMELRANQPNPRSLPWIFLVFEEAQLYIPQGCMRSLRNYGSVLDVITVGRNYNVRFGIISQFPANIDKLPIKICQQRFFGLTTEKNDITYLKAFLEKPDVDSVKKLQKLEFIYQYRGETQKFKFSPYNTPSKDMIDNFTLNGQSTSFNYFV